MKGYVTGNKLYIFDTPAEIPYVDAAVEIIYVQQEYLAAFKAANSDYAALMQPYNFQMLTVKAKEWSGHTNDDIVAPEPPAPTTYSITLSQEGEYCHGSWEGDVEAGTICSLTPESGYSFDQTATGTILLASSEQAQLSFDSEKGTIDFEMPAEAVTITVSVYQIRNAISYEGTAAENVIGPANGAGGEEITIIPNEGYTYDEESQSATPIGVRAFDASDENVELEVTVDYQNDIATFTMPAYAVRVTADIVVP